MLALNGLGGGCGEHQQNKWILLTSKISIVLQIWKKGINGFCFLIIDFENKKR